MGNGMNKVLPGLYLGNFRDAKDTIQLSENKITHILSIHDNSRPILMDKVYLCIPASDSPTQNISQYFSQCNDFIHNARVNGGGVLVHCLAGVSRSVTIVVAYVMSVTELGWRESLNAVRGARTCASPNFGFQRQLLEFQHESLLQERERLKDKFLSSPYSDLEECRRLIELNSKWITGGEYLSNCGAEQTKSGTEDGDQQSDVQNSSLLSQNNENLQNENKAIDISRKEVEGLSDNTISKLSARPDSGRRLSSDSNSDPFCVDGMREALKDAAGKVLLRSEEQKSDD